MMTRQYTWLKILLTTWILCGILWFGFSLPTLLEANNANSNAVQKSFYELVSENSIEYSIPRNLVSPIMEADILMTNWHDSLLTELSLSLTQNKMCLLSIEGKHLTTEPRSLGIDRAKYMKELLHNKGLDTFRILTNFREIGPKHSDGKFIYDVLGFTLKSKNNEIIKTRTIRFSSDSRDEHVFESRDILNAVVNMSKVLRVNAKMNFYLKISASNAYDDIDYYRSKIQSIKNQLTKLGIPNYKIIGDIIQNQNMPKNEILYEIELK